MYVYIRRFLRPLPESIELSTYKYRYDLKHEIVCYIKLVPICVTQGATHFQG